MADELGSDAAWVHGGSPHVSLDMLRARAGVANASGGAASKESAKRLVDILMAGIQSPHPPKTLK